VTTTAAEPLVHDYTPRGACREVFMRRDPEVLISGPAGTGKSRACLEKLHQMCLINPGMRGLIVRKTATSLTSSALVTWKRDVIPESLEAGALTFYGGSAEEPAQYRYANGSKVMLGGMDKASKVMSTEYDVIYVQEAIELTEDDWLSLSTRLRNGVVSFQQMLADCNPSFATHWLKLRCDAGKTAMLHSKHSDNPRLYDDEGGLTVYGGEYLGRLDALSGVVRDRLRDGKWSSAEGVIYDGFDSGLHVLDAGWVPPDDWPRWWSIDWGYTNPFVCQMWAEDSDGRLVLYREFYRTGRTVDRHTADILEVVAPGGVWVEPKPRVVVADHDPEAQAVFRRESGLSVVDARKDVAAGLQAVKRRLVVQGDGRPRLFVVGDARVDPDVSLVERHLPTSTLEEFPAYVWSDRRQDEPVKQHDHGMDALRYVVMLLESRVVPRFRWVE